MLNTNTTGSASVMIGPEDYLTSLEMELREPIPGEEFDILPEVETLSWEVGFSKFCRRLKRRQASKARYKK